MIEAVQRQQVDGHGVALGRRRQVVVVVVMVVVVHAEFEMTTEKKTNKKNQKNKLDNIRSTLVNK